MAKQLQTIAALACMTIQLMLFNFTFWVSKFKRFVYKVVMYSIIVYSTGPILSAFFIGVRYNLTMRWSLDETGVAGLHGYAT